MGMTPTAMTNSGTPGDYNWTYNLTTSAAPGTYYMYINATDDGTNPGPMSNDTMMWQEIGLMNNITITVVQFNRDIVVTAAGFPDVVRNEDASAQGGELTDVFSDPDDPDYASALTFEMKLLDETWVAASPAVKDFTNFTVKLLSTGNVTITPKADMYTTSAGQDVEFRATDHPTTTPSQPSKMDTHIVNVEITGVNDEPEITLDIPLVIIDEDTTTMIMNLTQHFNDLKDKATDSLVFTAEHSENMTVTINDNGSATDASDDYVEIELVDNWYGDDMFTIIASDGVLENSSEVAITVLAINDGPSVNASGTNYTDFVVTGDQGDMIEVMPDVVDLDDTAFTFTVSLISGMEALPTNLLIDSTTGVITFNPGNKDTGMFYVNVTVEDGGGGEGTSAAMAYYTNFTFDITNINDAPSAPGAIEVMGGVLGDGMTYDVVNESLKVNVKSSAAIDIDDGYLAGHALTYAWDMDNDGTADITASSLPTDSTSCDRPGRIVQLDISYSECECRRST